VVDTDHVLGNSIICGFEKLNFKDLVNFLFKTLGLPFQSQIDHPSQDDEDHPSEDELPFPRQ